MAKKEKTQKDIENPYIEKLSALGFSKAESLIYLYLLERGSEIGVSKIAIGTKMHRQQVYMTLPSLLDQGVIEEIQNGNISKYQARSPQVLEKLARKKMVVTEDVVQELQKISKIGHEQEFEIFVGEKAIRNYQLEFVEKAQEGETQYIIGGSAPEFIALLGDSYAGMLATQEKKQFVTYYLGHQNEGEALTQYKKSRINFHERLLAGIPQKMPQFTVRRNTVELYSFFNPPILYVIKSKEVSEKFHEFFMTLWEMAEGKS